MAGGGLQPAGPPLQGDRRDGPRHRGRLVLLSPLGQAGDELADGGQVLPGGECELSGCLAQLVILKCCADRGHDLSESISQWEPAYLLTAR